MSYEHLIRRQEELQHLEDARKRELDRRQQLEMAREDARKKELEEMQHRQEMLRAQIEGSYKQEPLGYSGEYGRGDNVPPNALFHDALAQEMMGGQGGLGPAPSRFDSPHGGMPPRGDPAMMGPRMERGFGRGEFSGGPHHGQRRGFGEMDFDVKQKRRRY